MAARKRLGSGWTWAHHLKMQVESRVVSAKAEAGTLVESQRARATARHTLPQSC